MTLPFFCRDKFPSVSPRERVRLPLEDSSETRLWAASVISLPLRDWSRQRNPRDKKDFPVPFRANIRFWSFSDSSLSRDKTGPIWQADILIFCFGAVFILMNPGSRICVDIFQTRKKVSRFTYARIKILSTSDRQYLQCYNNDHYAVEAQPPAKFYHDSF